MNNSREFWRSLYRPKIWVIYLLGLLLCLAIVLPGLAQIKAPQRIRTDCDSIKVAITRPIDVIVGQTKAKLYDNICYADGTKWVEPDV
ncbi:MAG: hypothetical protein WCD18_20685, partial [Thermosynechococcaceae cyanobacterium]